MISQFFCCFRAFWQHVYRHLQWDCNDAHTYATVNSPHSPAPYCEMSIRTARKTKCGLSEDRVYRSHTCAYRCIQFPTLHRQSPGNGTPPRYKQRIHLASDPFSDENHSQSLPYRQLSYRRPKRYTTAVLVSLSRCFLSCCRYILPFECPIFQKTTEQHVQPNTDCRTPEEYCMTCFSPLPSYEISYLFCSRTSAGMMSSLYHILKRSASCFPFSLIYEWKRDTDSRLSSTI